MVVERLPGPALFFHDPRACLRIGRGPLDDPVLEQLVDKVLESVGEVAPSPAGVSRPIQSSTFQREMEARPRPSSSIESRKAATRGSGRGRIISEMTFVSISHASEAVIPRPHG